MLASKFVGHLEFFKSNNLKVKRIVKTAKIMIVRLVR